MKVRLAIALAAMLALLTSASVRSQGDAEFQIVGSFDIDSTTMTYALFDPPRSRSTPIKTVGSTTTVTAVSGLPFVGVAAGDRLFVRDVAADQQVRYVVIRTSDTQVIVDTAVNWDRAAGFPFEFSTLRTGTGDAAGWFNVSRYKGKQISFGVEQLNVTGGVAVQIECVTGATGATPTLVYPPGGTTQCQIGTFTTVGATSRCYFNFNELQATRCRWGIRIVTADDGDDTGVNRENVHAEFSGRDN